MHRWQDRYPSRSDESPAGANRAGLLLDPFDERNRQRPLFIDDDNGFERAAFCAHVGGNAVAPPLREVSGFGPELLKPLTRAIRLAEMQEQVDKREARKERGLHRRRRNRLDAVEYLRPVLEGDLPPALVLENLDRQIPRAGLQGMLQGLLELAFREEPLRRAPMERGNVNVGLLGESATQEIAKEVVVAVPPETVRRLRDEEALSLELSQGPALRRRHDCRADWQDPP